MPILATVAIQIRSYQQPKKVNSFWFEEKAGHLRITFQAWRSLFLQGERAEE